MNSLQALRHNRIAAGYRCPHSASNVSSAAAAASAFLTPVDRAMFAVGQRVAPLAPSLVVPLARARLADFRRATGGTVPLVAVGGIGDAAEAYARIRAGASAVQFYSAMVYEGPGLVTRMKRDLAARLRADGFTNVAQAVGAR